MNNIDLTSLVLQEDSGNYGCMVTQWFAFGDDWKLHRGSGFVLEFRLQPDTYSGTQTLYVCESIIFDAGIALQLIDGAPSMTFVGQSAITAPSSIPTGEKVHLMFEWTGTVGRIYVNGSQVATGSLSQGVDSVTEHRYYWFRGMSAEYYTGVIDYVRLWSAGVDPSTVYGYRQHILNSHSPDWMDVEAQWYLSGKALFNAFEEHEYDGDTVQGYFDFVNNGTDFPDAVTVEYEGWAYVVPYPTCWPDTKVCGVPVTQWDCTFSGHHACFDTQALTDVWMWGKVPDEGVPVIPTWYEDWPHHLEMAGNGGYVRSIIDSVVELDQTAMTVALDSAYWPEQYLIGRIVFALALDYVPTYTTSPDYAEYAVEKNHILFDGVVVASGTLYELGVMRWVSGGVDYHYPESRPIPGYWAVSNGDTGISVEFPPDYALPTRGFIITSAKNGTLQADYTLVGGQQNNLLIGFQQLDVLEPPVVPGGDHMLYTEKRGVASEVQFSLHQYADPRQKYLLAAGYQPTLYFESVAGAWTSAASTNVLVHLGEGDYTLALTAAEMAYKRIRIAVERNTEQDFFSPSPIEVRTFTHDIEDLASDHDDIVSDITDQTTALQSDHTNIRGDISSAESTLQGEHSDISAAIAAIDFATVESLLQDIVDDGVLIQHAAGATSQLITVNDGTDPISNAHVWITSGADPASEIIGSSHLLTNASGQVTLWTSAIAGQTVYVWVQANGYSFAHPFALDVGDVWTVSGSEASGITYDLQTLAGMLATRLGDSKLGWYKETGELEGYLKMAYIYYQITCRLKMVTVLGSIVSGQRAYGLGTIHQARAVNVGSSWIPLKNIEDIDLGGAMWRDDVGDPQEAVQVGKNLIVAPVPDASGAALRVDGWGAETSGFTEDTDTPDLMPVGLELALIDKAEAIARVSRPEIYGNTTQAAAAEAKAREWVLLIGGTVHTAEAR